MMLISVEMLIMLCILLFVRVILRASALLGFAIGESLGAAAYELREVSLPRSRILR